MNKNGIIVFLRYPEAGNVKTQISSFYGNEFAVKLYQFFVQDVLNLTKKINAEKLIYYTPEKYRDRIEEWLGKDNFLFKQTRTELGERMLNAFREQF